MKLSHSTAAAFTAIVFVQGAFAATQSVELSTPAGITVQSLERGRTDVYATPAGMTLYTYDKDTETGKSACVDDCAKTWPPAVVSSSAKAFGDWTLIRRADGSKQWALRGKPLYAFARDAAIGAATGEAPNNGWHVAAFEAGKGVVMPTGIKVGDVAGAGGVAFTNSAGMPLYIFDGDPVRDKTACTAGPCTNHWVPALAGQLARPVGEFTVLSRDDGIFQWAYRGKALYAFDGDTQPGDAVGSTIDKRWQVVLVRRHFMPGNVTIRHNHFEGYNLATADGMTIYELDRFRSVNGGHSLRIGSESSAQIGRMIGTHGCDAACLSAWRPLLAPANAQPSGKWEIATRDDGNKQWVYQGYALYTYTGDNRPGDMNGNDLYDYMGRYVGVNDPFLAAERPEPKEAGGRLPAMGAPATFWHAVLP